MYRFRVLNETEQIELIELAKERTELQMLKPVICGLHGANGVDVRSALKGAYNPMTGILPGQRHKTGQAKFSVPIAPALKPYLDRYVMALRRAEWLFSQFLVGEFGEPCEPRGRINRVFQRLVAGTDFDGVGFRWPRPRRRSCKWSSETDWAFGKPCRCADEDRRRRVLGRRCSRRDM
jgi:hypothetical protein